MNLMKCEEKDKNDITNEIKKNETNIECNITGEKKKRTTIPSKFFRICEKCNRIIYYKSKSSLVYALNQNRKLCYSCKHTIREKDTIYKRKCPLCNKEITYSCYITCERQNRKRGLCGSCSQSHKKVMGSFKRNCPVCSVELVYDKKRTRDRAIKNNRMCLSCSISRKNRIRHQKEREKWGQITVPCFNRNACKFFDELNTKNGWNLQHAENGGEVFLKEVGYWLDAYDKERNVVVEYDEPHHFSKNGELKKKDVDRMIEICKHLKCEFWRYNEKKGKLEKYEY